MKFIVTEPTGKYWVTDKGFNTYNFEEATLFDEFKQAQAVANRFRGAEVIKHG